MQAIRFEFEAEFEAPVESLWSFHMRPDALQILSPALSGFRVLDRGRGVAEASVLRAEVGFGPWAQEWSAIHSGVSVNRSFTDTALTAPFPYWVHQHGFESLPGARSRLRDTIWLLPPKWMPRWIARPFLAVGLGILFAWRHRRTREHVEDSRSSNSFTQHHPALTNASGSQ